MSLKSLLLCAALLASMAAPGFAADPLPALTGAVRSIPAGCLQAAIYSAGQNQLYVANTYFGYSILQLAPGGWIRDAQNLVVLPTSVSEPVLARFTLDETGLVNRVWILSEQEIQQAQGN